MSAVDERRKFKRLRYGVEVEISYYGDDSGKGEKVSRLRTEDIGAGGIRVTIHDRLETGALITVKLTIPHTDKEITCFAQVAWVNSAAEGRHETGLAFMGLSNREIIAINDFVESELDKGIE